VIHANHSFEVQDFSHLPVTKNADPAACLTPTYATEEPPKITLDLSVKTVTSR
jgi:hypothetical protein